ncbi:SDR family NAD(P)-dependent oxidoreductase [Novosphingobium aureum]|nr:SDR family NAD(P)-dependent oxidoreductase [Novosphingobium aureum]
MRGVEGRNAEAARPLQAEGEERVHPIEMDVLSEDSCAAAVEAIHAANLHLDVVVNNAGMLMNGMAETFTPDQFLTILDTNAVSWLRVNRAVLPMMREQGHGTIVYVGSTTSYIPEPFIGVYEASKAAGDALARAMALEIRPFGIDSLFLVPGAFPVGTDHFADAHTGDDRGRVDHVFIDGQAKGADVIAETMGEAQARFIERLGFVDLLAPMQRRMLNVPERPC